MGKSIVLFDGVCNLCTGTVRFIIHRDPQAHFQFAALQSPYAQGRLTQSGYSGSLSESIVLIEDAGVYTESTAMLRIVRKLSGVWPLFYVLIVVPRPIRDWAYSLIARNRYRWFGRQDTCMTPTPNLRQRFLG
jgi:predicted DCC family thiol-disulfide oxidoreductase YuxK